MRWNAWRSVVPPRMRSAPLWKAESPSRQSLAALDFGGVSHLTEWKGRYYEVKQLEAYAVREGPDWLVLTLITRFV